MSPVGDSCAVFREVAEYLVGRLVPHVWLGVVVPPFNPGADRGDEFAYGVNYCQRISDSGSLGVAPEHGLHGSSDQVGLDTLVERAPVHLERAGDAVDRLAHLVGSV